MTLFCTSRKRVYIPGLISECFIKKFAIFYLETSGTSGLHNFQTNQSLDVLPNIFLRRKKFLINFFLSFHFLLHWMNFSSKELKWIKERRKARRKGGGKKERKKQEERGRKEGQTGNNKKVRLPLNLEVKKSLFSLFFWVHIFCIYIFSNVCRQKQRWSCILTFYWNVTANEWYSSQSNCNNQGIKLFKGKLI